MTADGRRSRGQSRPDAARRGRPKVAGERAAERRREATPEPPSPSRRGPSLPSLRAPRLPRPRRLPHLPHLPHLPQGTARARSPRLTALLAVLVVLLAVGVGYVAVSLRNAEASETAAANGQVTAARYAEQLLSYDHAHLDRDFAQAQRLLTDDFRKEYTDATEVVRDKAIEDRAVIKASVVATSVVSAEPDEVKTLLFVNQTTTTGDGRSPSIDLNRVVLTLVEQDGRWLVSDLDAL